MKTIKLISQGAVNVAVDVCCYFDWDWDKSGPLKPGVTILEEDDPDVFVEIVKSLKLTPLSPVSDYLIKYPLSEILEPTYYITNRKA